MKLVDLMEDRQIGLAKSAYSKLSEPAQDAIDRWESYNWIGGPLEKHFEANDEIAQEIEAAFAPIRAILPPAIKLYRGIILDSSFDHSRKILESWTSDRKVAEIFAGLRTSKYSLLNPVPTQEEIDAAVKKYEETGYVNFLGYHYVRRKDQPQYYYIYDKRKNFITDGDDLREKLTDDKDWKESRNRKKLEKARIFEEMIPRERIIWLTNNLNCKEYLVKILK